MGRACLLCEHSPSLPFRVCVSRRTGGRKVDPPEWPPAPAQTQQVPAALPPVVLTPARPRLSLECSLGAPAPGGIFVAFAALKGCRRRWSPDRTLSSPANGRPSRREA